MTGNHVGSCCTARYWANRRAQSSGRRSLPRRDLRMNIRVVLGASGSFASLLVALLLGCDVGQSSLPRMASDQAFDGYESRADAFGATVDARATIDLASATVDAAIDSAVDHGSTVDAGSRAESSPPSRCVCEPGTFLDYLACRGSPYLLGCTCSDDGLVLCSTDLLPTCPGGVCHDGSELTCCGPPPWCPEGLDVTVLAGCWVCVDVATCVPVLD